MQSQSREGNNGGIETKNSNGEQLTEVSQLDMSENVEATFLDVIDEGDEAHAAARVGNHQEDLGPPKLDVVLPHVQHQQVFTHLQGAGQ